MDKPVIENMEVQGLEQLKSNENNIEQTETINEENRRSYPTLAPMTNEEFKLFAKLCPAVLNTLVNNAENYQVNETTEDDLEGAIEWAKHQKQSLLNNKKE